MGRTRRQQDWGLALAALGVGVAGGVVFGLLAAPRSGRVSRQKIATSITDAEASIERAAEQGAEAVRVALHATLERYGQPGYDPSELHVSAGEVAQDLHALEGGDDLG